VCILSKIAAVSKVPSCHIKKTQNKNVTRATVSVSINKHAHSLDVICHLTTQHI